MLKFTIVVAGKTQEDVEIALEHALQKIQEGFLCGLDGNDTSSYTFESEGWEEPAEEEA